MEREGDIKVNGNIVERRMIGWLKKWVRKEVIEGMIDERRIVRIEEDVEMLMIEIMLVGSGRGLRNEVGIIENKEKIEDEEKKGLREESRMEDLDERIEEDEIIGIEGDKVVVNIIVGEEGKENEKEEEFLMIDKEDEVILEIVDRKGREGRKEGRVEEVIEKERKINNEGVLKMEVDLIIKEIKIVVIREIGELEEENLLKVREKLDIINKIEGDKRERKGGRNGEDLEWSMEMEVIEIERLVIIVDLRKVGIGENIGEDEKFWENIRIDIEVIIEKKEEVKIIMVLKLIGKKEEGIGIEIVEKGILEELKIGKEVFESDGEGVEEDKIVEIKKN